MADRAFIVRPAELTYHADGFLWQYKDQENIPEAPVWVEAALVAEHMGDCNGLPMSCMRCHAEEAFRDAEWVAARLPARDGQ